MLMCVLGGTESRATRKREISKPPNLPHSGVRGFCVPSVRKTKALGTWPPQGCVVSRPPIRPSMEEPSCRGQCSRGRRLRPWGFEIRVFLSYSHICNESGHEGQPRGNGSGDLARMDVLRTEERRPMWLPCGISMGQAILQGEGGEWRGWRVGGGLLPLTSWNVRNIAQTPCVPWVAAL